MLWEVEKSKCATHYKRGLESCGMMKGFQIWSQNLNRITFDPLLAKTKLSKTDNIPYFASFRPFFGHKWSQMLSNFNSDTRFGILSSTGSESESEPESLGVVVASQESESESESIKLPRLQLRNVLFESVI